MRISYIIATLLLAGIFASCTRENQVVEPVKIVADTGGNATINIIPRYLNKDIDSCVVYVYYNSKRAPESIFQYNNNMVAKPSGGRPTASFKGLKLGDYYFYGEGYDASRNWVLRGGATFKVVDSIPGTSYTVLLDLHP
ncbi:MAG: hypothetical protein R2800_15155 [Flavipsychrobacter sp.]